jgi:hypothetical protein
VAWLEEMAKHLGLSAAIYSAHFDVVAPELGGLKEHYNNVISGWISKYLQGKTGIA